ncbi:MAG TPA: hypothetical protein VGW75_13240 [Solirubrobacteraceae bacterium]|nr:hypothetical protein [Solirubrobacteraceae bacterium]
MASTVDKRTLTEPVENELAVAIDERQYEAALRDPKVRALHQDADALLRELEANGRSV